MKALSAILMAVAIALLLITLNLALEANLSGVVSLP